MNTNILKKCVEELKKEEFKKEYVIGMLETLIEMSPTHPVAIPNNTYHNVSETTPTRADEQIPPFLKSGPIGGLQ